MTKTPCILLLAASITANAASKELPKPCTPNPGLRYYYPVPKEAVPKTHDFDIVIYGASPAAISAACQARKMGKTVGVFVFRRHIGGMSSSGLSDVDYGKKESIGGMARKVFLDFFKKQVQSPAEVEKLFLSMLSGLDIPVFFEHRLEKVEREGERITKITFENGNAARAKIFMDTTYEGDLMAARVSSMWQAANPTPTLVRSSTASRSAHAPLRIIFNGGWTRMLSPAIPRAVSSREWTPRHMLQRIMARQTNAASPSASACLPPGVTPWPGPDLQTTRWSATSCLSAM